MALKTLEEINQEFLFERLAGGGHKTVLVTYRSKTSKLNKNLIRPRSGHHNLPFATCHLPFGLRSRPLAYKERAGAFPLKIAAPSGKALAPLLALLRHLWAKGTISLLIKKKHGRAALISDILFYLAMLVILIAAVFAGQGGGAPPLILGYSHIHLAFIMFVLFVIISFSIRGLTAKRENTATKKNWSLWKKLRPPNFSELRQEGNQGPLNINISGASRGKGSAENVKQRRCANA